MQSIANTSNISNYIHLHATEKFTSWRVFWDVFCTNFKTQFVKSQAYIWLINLWCLSCLGAYLYLAGTQYRNLLKWLVMTSMVICHQQILGHMNTYWAEIHKQKPLLILKKIHLFQLLSNNLYRTHLTSSNNKRGLCSKMTPPFFFKVTDVTRVHGSPQQVWLPLSERHFMQHWLVERTRVWRVYSATPAAGHGWAGTHQQGWGSF